MADAMLPTKEQAEEIGWNSPEHDNPVLFQRLVCQQLSLIGVVLIQIRDQLAATQGGTG